LEGSLKLSSHGHDSFLLVLDVVHIYDLRRIESVHVCVLHPKLLGSIDHHEISNLLI